MNPTASPLGNFLIKILGILVAYFAPVKEITIAVLVLFIIDWITGVWRSKILKRRFTSYRMRKSIYKLTAYLLAIYTCHIFDESLISFHLHLPQLMAGFIGATELLSILENLSGICGIDFLKVVEDKLKNYKLKKE